MTSRMLIVEDDFDVAEMLVTFFQAQHYQVHHAESGLVGIEMARKIYPNIILLDVMMPEIDGYETCRRLRQTALTRYIPIIFLTQRDERSNKVKGLELGADDYITKPFDLDELRLRVQGAMRRATQESLHEARTGLPTAALVEEELERRSFIGEPYTDLRFTLKGYKAYGDVYGFLAGNDVFAFAAGIIRDAVQQHGSAEDFIGVLGDEFVILTNSTDVAHMRQNITSAFREGVGKFYSFQDVERGGVVVDAETPQERTVPLMQMVELDAEV